jgi:hypothetical protein
MYNNTCLNNMPENNLIPITEDFKQTLIKNDYSIKEMGYVNGVEIFRAEKEFVDDHISFDFYINPQMVEMSYSVIKRIPIELPEKNEE